ncbi:DUF4085 family protein [Clostridium lundense]|uniref:DUF4085 family protein n=1 Tax=Clostridium lundense TaxID=319475 RepID=UPI0004877D1D|nr:DUF4085 family protein [Clostridium lundense]
MHYFTKKWYELCQKTNAHLILEEEEKAASFSDEYFQQLYNEKLTEYLALQKKIASCTFDDIYPKEMSAEYFNDNMSQREIESLKASYKTNRELAKENYVSPEPFDSEKLSKKFYETFIYKQQYIKKILPKEILEKILDIRVYVLDKASNEVIKAVTEFCKANETSVKKTFKEYEIYYKKALKSFDVNIVENLNFHDCTIVDIKKTKQCLSILFDSSNGFTDINEIQFNNFKIIKQDGLLKNSWWLYDEIYKINNKYELHVLLQNKNMGLVEFIISAEHIFFKHNKEID